MTTIEQTKIMCFFFSGQIVVFYVITIEAIHKICSRFGPVVRIVMIRRRGTQTMVEFRDAETARRAMEELQNQDIYSGCCTLQTDYKI